MRNESELSGKKEGNGKFIEKRSLVSPKLTHECGHQNCMPSTFFCS